MDALSGTTYKCTNFRGDPVEEATYGNIPQILHEDSNFIVQFTSHAADAYLSATVANTVTVSYGVQSIQRGSHPYCSCGLSEDDNIITSSTLTSITS